MAPLKELLNPWQKISWNHEQTHNMFRDWARFYAKRGHLDTAMLYNDKALKLRDDDEKTLLQRSKCRRRISRPEDALNDSSKALKYARNEAAVNLEISDALYDLNEFEICKMDLHSHMNKYRHNSKGGGLTRRMDVVNENFNDSLGDSLGPFFLKNERHFANAMDHHKRKVDDRSSQSLWKFNYEQNKCDVQSVVDLEELFLSPLETARRKRAYKVYTQIYFPSGWNDVLFLKELCCNPFLLLPQSKKSTPQLREITQQNYDTVTRSLKMLHARSPLYHEQARRSTNKKLWQRQKEAYLYRAQFQTRRNSLAILRNVRFLRKLGNIENLTSYVEEVMGDYIVLKTHRVMPWRYEFVHEVYNILALAHADQFVLPQDMGVDMRKGYTDPILWLLHIPTDVYKEYVPFVFGDRSTYQQREDYDPANSTYKKYIARLEKRIRFAKYSTERCYLLFEITRSHLMHRSYDDCLMAYQRAYKEAKRCDNALWKFHCIMLILKFYVMLRKIERAKDVLREAKAVLVHLKSPKLTAFVEMCISLLQQQIEIKKRSTKSQYAMDRKKRSRYSLTLSHLSEDGSLKDNVETRENSQNASFESAVSQKN